jgi:hypothetical protein
LGAVLCSAARQAAEWMGVVMDKKKLNEEKRHFRKALKRVKVIIKYESFYGESFRAEWTPENTG